MADLLKVISESRDFVEIRVSDRVAIDLKYATTDNFMRENVYQDFRRAFLHKLAFQKFEKAIQHLQKSRPEHKFLVLDALRPRSVQRILWNKVKGTTEEKYVANPDKGSMHNFGLALDLTIVDEHGRWLDMGSGFDDFRELSQPILEDQFIEKGVLTATHMRNRLLLRDAMQAGGFLTIKTEWWHFNALSLEEARRDYQIIE